jgi:hypothetical protein
MPHFGGSWGTKTKSEQASNIGSNSSASNIGSNSSASNIGSNSSASNIGSNSASKTAKPGHETAYHNATVIDLWDAIEYVQRGDGHMP